MKKPELLIPAGSLEVLKTAVRYGADAVYIGGDILCNKKTFMLINALQKAEGDDKAELLKWINAKEFIPEEKIKSVTAIYNNVKIKDFCQAKIEQLFADALAELEQVNVAESKKTELKDFADKLLGRNK